jgi:uncharacterized protein YdbL (DUF1318 family)
MSMIRKLITLIAAFAALGAVSIAHAQRGDPALMQARAQGIVGEMYTGYLGIADESRATPDIRRRVDEANAKRLAIYTDTAKETGQTVAVIAALTAEKQIAGASAGEVVKPGGSEPWTKK